jgi:hypothetical protein
MFYRLIPDSPILYAGVKMAKKMRRNAKAKKKESFTPEFKARFSNLIDELDEKSKVKYEEAKAKRRAI